MIRHHVPPDCPARDPESGEINHSDCPAVADEKHTAAESQAPWWQHIAKFTNTISLGNVLAIIGLLGTLWAAWDRLQVSVAQIDARYAERLAAFEHRLAAVEVSAIEVARDTASRREADHGRVVNLDTRLAAVERGQDRMLSKLEEVLAAVRPTRSERLDR